MDCINGAKIYLDNFLSKTAGFGKRENQSHI